MLSNTEDFPELYNTRQRRMRIEEKHIEMKCTQQILKILII